MKVEIVIFETPYSRWATASFHNGLDHIRQFIRQGLEDDGYTLAEVQECTGTNPECTGWKEALDVILDDPCCIDRIWDDRCTWELEVVEVEE